MKNILIISASARRGGNSDTLCDAFLKGAEGSGNKVEKIFLADKKIGYCTGCYACASTHKCVQKDDMEEILDKMIKADVIVLSSPIYFYMMNAQLKTLIDRTVPRYTEIKDKDFYYIIAAADSSKKNMQKAIDGFGGFTLDCLEGAKEKGIIYGLGAWQKGDIKKTSAVEESYKMGKSIK